MVGQGQGSIGVLSTWIVIFRRLVAYKDTSTTDREIVVHSCVSVIFIGVACIFLSCFRVLVFRRLRSFVSFTTYVFLGYNLDCRSLLDSKHKQGTYARTIRARVFDIVTRTSKTRNHVRL